MWGYALIAAFAYLFYKVGENDYARKGWLLALVSILLSFCGVAIGLGFIGVCGGNALLYLICFGYNLLSKGPPGSSGF